MPRHAAGGKGNPKRPGATRDLFRRRPDILKRTPLFSKIAGNLMDEKGAGDSARLSRPWNGDVVRHDDHGDILAEALRALDRQTEIQSIPSIVFDDDQTTGFAGDA